MNTVFRHLKAFAFLLSFALIFVNTAGAVGMVSMQHGAPGPDSSQSVHAQMAAMSDHAHGSAHIQSDSNTPDMDTTANPDCMSDSTCASSCAAHCVTTVFFGSPQLTARNLVTRSAHFPPSAPHAAMVAGLYKPPKPLH